MGPASFDSQNIYSKSLALQDLSKAIAAYFSSNRDGFARKRYGSFRDDISKSLVTDANLITKQIRLASSSSSYSTRMKSLAFINVMTQNILAYCNGLERDGVKEKEYLNLLRKEIRSFRVSFKKWRKSFQNGTD
ncbi:hypothetical protein [Flagellimonas meridianipacifica]|uniref:Four helix bundle protein n=1 Tax=Flagellimonas meridianipacifica TaxID=1080225 RepID=A0A2T0M954_9FLAO|nr:hypothetical protein [Allomuricauda pacifica]PRX54034.1 hypothetical protein CLV81_2430 [Allomuricauda pacifica]